MIPALAMIFGLLLFVVLGLRIMFLAVTLLFWLGWLLVRVMVFGMAMLDAGLLWIAGRRKAL